MNCFFQYGFWEKSLLATAIALTALGCADKAADPAKPAIAEHKSMSERLNESGGFKQDADGNWVPKSDKRSSYDSQGESPYFKGKIKKEQYKTGDYAKKSWWGSDKDFGNKKYEGKTDGSRFQTEARQNGQVARDSDRKAKLSGPYETNTLGRESSRESNSSAIPRPLNESVESRRQIYQAPSVIDWRAQREMSMEQSKGILGR